jgi:hypothetical protein
VLILKDLKSSFPEVLILIDFKSFASEVLNLVGLKSFIMRELQKSPKFLEVLILEDLAKSLKVLILLALGEKQGDTTGRNSNVNAIYTYNCSTVFALRQGRGAGLLEKPLKRLSCRRIR